MASPNIWPGGLNLSGTVFSGGGTAAALTDDYFSGAIQFLDTINGSDGNSGSQPELPVKTLARAVVNSAANGIILIGQGSAETLLGAQTFLNAGQRIIGCGSGASRPRYTCGGASINMFDIQAAGVAVENIYFPASTGAGSARVSFTAASGEIRDCYFECGSNDTANTVACGAGSANTLIKGTTFASVASRPAVALAITAAVADIAVDTCIFDGGAFGWSDDAFKISAAATRLKPRNVQMINRSDFNITVTATSYQAFGLMASGTSRINITA